MSRLLRERGSGAWTTLRSLAGAAGLSSEQLSDLERGVRRPSADLLIRLATALQASADALHAGVGESAGRSDDRYVVAVIRSDPGLTQQQKRVLVDIYEAFRQENDRASDSPTSPGASDSPTSPGAEAAPGSETLPGPDIAVRPEPPAPPVPAPEPSSAPGSSRAPGAETAPGSEAPSEADVGASAPPVAPRRRQRKAAAQPPGPAAADE